MWTCTSQFVHVHCRLLSLLVKDGVLSLTGVWSVAEVASPVAQVNEGDKWIDVGPTHTTTDNDVWVDHRTLLKDAHNGGEMRGRGEGEGGRRKG